MTDALENSMKIFLIMLLFIPSFMYAPNAYSDGTEGGAVLIKGNLECHDWTKARSTGGSVNLEHYVQGFLNGYALGSGVDLWQEPSDVQPAAIFNVLDAHCSANLFKPVVTAIFDVLRQRGNID